MKMSSTPSRHHTDENRSRPSETIQNNNRQSRRSHVSLSSNKRPSVNTGGTHSTKVKQGMFHRAVPQMPRALAFLCFVLNLILPGTGMKIGQLVLEEKEYSFRSVIFFYFSLILITNKRSYPVV
jgi:hypothetical protein